jgi:hypothetical protein
MKKPQDPPSGWAPEFTLDLASATAQQFFDIADAFEASTAALGDKLPPLPFTENGWYTNTPQAAEAALRRNRPGSNRKLSFATVYYYWQQMKADAWPRTGQPVIFNVEEWLNDGQHREWASYLGLISFDTYVIVDAPIVKNVFAYIDNVKVRTPAAALQTAKFNGLSSLISQTIQIASNYDLAAYTCLKKKSVFRMSPIQYLNYAEQHQGIKAAVRLVAAEHKEAMEAIGHKDVTTFVAYKISELHNEEICERFLEEIVSPNESSSNGETMRALRVYLSKQAKTADPAPKHIVLAHVIKAFNYWITGTPLKRVSVNTDDSFPQFAEPEGSTEAEDEAAA